MVRKKSIIYVNYSPYENSSKILDFLLENFENVFLFAIGFHSLANKRDYNNLSIYRKGKLQKKYSLFQLPQSERFFSILIPVRSVITFFEIIIYSYWIKSKYKKIEIYFTVNAFTAWIGNLIKGYGIVEKTVFWVWDYYPLIHESKIIALMRYIYWQFDKISSHSDMVAFVNKRLFDLRRDIGIYTYEDGLKFPVIPLGTDRLPYKYSRRKPNQKILFGFIGVLKRIHGPEIIFENSKGLKKEFGDFGYEIVGSGPDKEYLENFAKKTGVAATFYGYLEDKYLNETLRKCDIGIATYKPDPNNISAYGDPGKIKLYLSLGVPVITTNLLEFAKEVERSGAGVIVDYYSKKDMIMAVKKIMANHAEYSRKAYKLSQKLYYKKIYPKMFKLP